MTKVKRANVVLSIEDSEVDRYVSMGYDVISSSGKILRKAIPTDIHQLQKSYRELIEEVQNLEKENATLHKQLSAAKTRNSKDSNKKV